MIAINIEEYNELLLKIKMLEQENKLFKEYMKMIVQVTNDFDYEIKKLKFAKK